VSRRLVIWLVVLLAHVPIVAAGWVSRHPPERQYREHAAEAPSAAFPFGTDDLGRDVLARTLHGTRLSLAAAVVATAITLLIAVVVGGLGGYVGAWLDGWLSLVIDASLAVPWIFLLLAVRAALPLGLPAAQAFLLVSVLVGITGWGGAALLVRAVVRQTTREEYVLAARALGATGLRLLTRHVLPATWPVVASQAAILFPSFVLAEVSLSFLGLGMSEPAASLGTLIGELRSLHVLETQPWRLAPVVVLVLLVISYNGPMMRLPVHRAWGSGTGHRIAAIALALASTVGCGAPRPSSEAPARELRIALRAEPRTFNPVTALDAVSTSLNALLHAELFRIDAQTHEAVPDLAERLDGPDAAGRYTITLRQGITFPDGEPFGADDVVFSLGVFQDPQVGSSQVQALRVGGQPMTVTALDDHRVRLTFGAPHPEPARLLAGVPMLPRHRLEAAWREQRLASVWTLTEAPAAIVGLGPFRLQSHEPGQRLRFIPNPSYWKRDDSGARLPRLAGVTAEVIADPDAQVARLLAGDLDVLSAIDTRSHGVIARASQAASLDLRDLGASLEYTFLLLNLDDPRGAQPAEMRRARWFQDVAFRQAVSQAIDRASMASLVYDGRATPIGTHVSPGNVVWHAGLPAPVVSTEAARARLKGAGYRWDDEGRLLDEQGARVAFTVLASTSNAQRQRLATMLQADLAALGIDVQVAALEFRALVDRVTKTRAFDAAIMALGGGDGDPNAEQNVWQRDGPTHLFRLGAATPLAPWETEIDALMRQQATELHRPRRQAQYARVQALVAEHLPIVPLVSPNHLVAVRRGLRGFAPGVTSRDSLWNIDALAWATRTP
jgi:peptide/nickel transport system substrate-binding protein